MQLCRPTSLTLKANILQFLVDGNMNINWAEYDLDYVICSGGHLDDELFSIACDIMNTNIINAYGLTETGLIAYSCKLGFLHVDPDVFVEIIDDQGNRLKPGKIGKILVSSLRNLAVPLLRYETGDIGSIQQKQCQCGSNSIVIHVKEGRVYSNFILENGAEFPTTQLNEIFDVFGFSDFQLSQITIQRFELKYDICAQKQFFEDDFTNYLSRKLESDVYVEFKASNIEQTGKFQRYRCDL